jgi:hypothetical protein
MSPKPDTALVLRSEEGKSAWRVFYRKVERLQIEVPHCRKCANKALRIVRFGNLSIVLGIIAAVALSLRFDLSRWAGFALAMVLCIPGMLVQTYVGAVRFVRYDDNLLEFRFKSAQYAELFYRLNSQGSAR